MRDTTATPAHITITVMADHYDAACSICHMSMKCGPQFGPIPGDILVQQWVKQHAHKAKAQRRKR